LSHQLKNKKIVWRRVEWNTNRKIKVCTTTTRAFACRKYYNDIDFEGPMRFRRHFRAIIGHAPTHYFLRTNIMGLMTFRYISRVRNNTLGGGDDIIELLIVRKPRRGQARVTLDFNYHYSRCLFRNECSRWGNQRCVFVLLLLLFLLTWLV